MFPPLLLFRILEKETGEGRKENGIARPPLRLVPCWQQTAEAEIMLSSLEAHFRSLQEMSQELFPLYPDAVLRSGVY